MSSRNAKRRAKFSPPDTQASDIDTVVVDQWIPDYGRQCEMCGKSPVVTGARDGRIVYAGSLCGVCTWGDAACIDPSRW